MWVIMQTGYRTTDGSAYGFGTSHVGPSRKLTAVCRTEAGAKKWLRRLDRWAADRDARSDPAKLIPTYETMKMEGLAGLEPALFVGPAYYGEHGREASLRQILLGLRESHTALRRESRRLSARRRLNRIRSQPGKPDASLLENTLDIV